MNVEIVAVVDHLGNEDSGHYWLHLKPEEEYNKISTKWLYFNDNLPKSNIIKNQLKFYNGN